MIYKVPYCISFLEKTSLYNKEERNVYATNSLFISIISLLVDHDAQIGSLSVMPNILPFQMLSTADFSHIKIMHSHFILG